MDPDSVVPPLAATEAGGGSGARAVERSLELLSWVGRAGPEGRGLAETVGATGLAKPTVRRLLLALIRAGLVEQDPVTRRYHPGPQLYALGVLAAPRFGLLDLVRPALARLSRQTGDTIFLTVPQGGDGLCLHRQEGDFPIRTHALQPGDRHPLGVGAGALAILAALPDDAVEAHLAEAAPRLGRYPALTPRVLQDAVAAARRDGYALNAGLIVPGSWGVGVAIRAPDGSIAGALSLAAIESRLGPDRQREVARLLRAEADAAEAALNRRLSRARNTA